MNCHSSPATVAGRPAVALFLALAAIVVIGLLVGSAFFGASLRNRLAANALLLSHARAIATHAEETTFMNLASMALDSLPVGGSTPRLSVNVTGNGEAIVLITRLQQNMYMVFTEAAPTSLAGAGIVRASTFYFRFATDTSGTASPPEVVRYPVHLTHRSWAEVYR
jgi:hypothetical protein